MKFMIGDKEYDAEAGVSKVSLATLYELKLRHGIGMKSIVEMTAKIGQFTDPMEVLEDKDAFQAFRVVIWLARKHAGEHGLSLDQATNFPLDQLRMINDEEEPEADPKVPADSAADESGSPTQAST